MAADRKADDQGKPNGLSKGESVVPTGRIRRAAPMAGFAARTAGERVVAALRTKAGNPNAKEAFHERTAERYAEMLGHSKGVLMKAGQLLSFVDVGSGGADSPFGIYQAALERLQQHAPPMDAATARTTIEEELGKPIDEVFASFESEPIAAASIGQVHEATMPDGRKVAVKVQYPGVADAVRADLANTELLATFLQLGTSAMPNYTRVQHRPAAHELAVRIAEEVDYRHEAGNIRRFAGLYRNHPFIHVPDVVAEASCDRVLTMTYVDGFGWDDAMRAEQALKDRWGEVLFRFGFGTYRMPSLLDGDHDPAIFNGDPHPGNYRFRDDGTIGFVDFGCVKELDEQTRRQLIDTVRAAVEGRGDDLRRLSIDAGFLAPGTPLEAGPFLEWYQGNLTALLAPQPFTYTPEFAAEIRERMYDPDPKSKWRHIQRHFDVPPAMVLLTRVEVGVHAAMAELHATGYWRAILDELDGVARAKTELGKAQEAWLARRTAKP